MEKKTRTGRMFAFAFLMVLLGLVLNYFGIGQHPFDTFGTAGNWLLYIGFVGLMVAAVATITRKNRVIDERMEYVASKAMRSAFAIFVCGAFAVMVVDAISPISMPIRLFASYMVCFLLIAYYVSYQILLRRN